MRSDGADPAEDLAYFVEWGGRPWVDLVREGLEWLGPRLDGHDVLEIGARSGRMSSLLALRGGQVVGVDIEPGFPERATAEARRWNVADRASFVLDDGRLGSIRDSSVDVIFSKSVLIMIEEQAAYIACLAPKLRVGGRFVFVENLEGGAVTRLTRRLRHPTWRLDRIRYLTEARLSVLRQHFDVEVVRQRKTPPIALICGHALPRAS